MTTKRMTETQPQSPMPQAPMPQAQPATVATIDTITSRRDAQRAYAALYAKNETNGLTDDEFSLAQAIICRWGDVKIGCAA